jgi:hypothetical protein
MRKIIYIAIAAAFFIGAIIGVFAGFSVPTQREKLVTHLTYDMKGNFGQQAFQRLEPELENPVVFTKLVDSIIIHYNYRLLSEEPVLLSRETVQVSAILSGQYWAKEIGLVPETEENGDFSLDFFLPLQDLMAQADNITAELGVSKATSIGLKATIHTEADTAAGIISDDFIQTLDISLSPTIMEFNQPLQVKELGYSSGLAYEHEGTFGYTIPLKSSLLYGGASVAESEPPPPPGELEPIKNSDTYRTDNVYSIDGTYAYSFKADGPLSSLVHDVEISATLGAGEGWQETLPLVPRNRQTGDFTATFTLDKRLLRAVIKSHEGENAEARAHQLLINAQVHTLGRSEYGPIDETYTSNLTVTLGPDQIIWPETDPTTRSGFLNEMVMVPNRAAGTAKMGSLGALGVTLVLLLYTTWNYWEYRRKMISKMEVDAGQADGKYKDAVIDVETLPANVVKTTPVEVDSLAELIKISESLFKPVLRLKTPEKHMYCVIEGDLRYQYISTKEYIKLSDYH